MFFPHVFFSKDFSITSIRHEKHKNLILLSIDPMNSPGESKLIQECSGKRKEEEKGRKISGKVRGMKRRKNFPKKIMTSNRWKNKREQRKEKKRNNKKWEKQGKKNRKERAKRRGTEKKKKKN